ncbi:MAG: hypothetical protein ACYDDI_02930 [Candidatus Acidiferrales bacterium]
MHQIAKAYFVADKLAQNVTITCANAYTAPTHSAITTKVYSVSFPVLRVWSQRSNISTTGHTKHVSKTRATITRDVLECTNQIMSEPILKINLDYVFPVHLPENVLRRD